MKFKKNNHVVEDINVLKLFFSVSKLFEFKRALLQWPLKHAEKELKIIQYIVG